MRPPKRPPHEIDSLAGAVFVPSMKCGRRNGRHVGSTGSAGSLSTPSMKCGRRNGRHTERPHHRTATKRRPLNEVRPPKRPPPAKWRNRSAASSNHPSMKCGRRNGRHVAGRGAHHPVAQPSMKCGRRNGRHSRRSVIECPFGDPSMKCGRRNGRHLGFLRFLRGLAGAPSMKCGRRNGRHFSRRLRKTR